MRRPSFAASQFAPTLDASHTVLLGVHPRTYCRPCANDWWPCGCFLTLLSTSILACFSAAALGVQLGVDESSAAKARPLQVPAQAVLHDFNRKYGLILSYMRAPPFGIERNLLTGH